MTWTQPLCQACWDYYYGRPAHKLLEPDSEQCCRCGAQTADGIYARINPASVPYPRTEP